MHFVGLAVNGTENRMLGVGKMGRAAPFKKGDVFVRGYDPGEKGSLMMEGGGLQEKSL